MLIACAFAALAALGLDKIADALFAANDAAHDAMTARRDERGARTQRERIRFVNHLRQKCFQLKGTKQ